MHTYPATPGTVVGNDYVLGHQIGQGSFAVVWKAENKTTGDTVAIKEINTAKLSRKLKSSLEGEVSILRRISHTNIVKLHHVIEDGDKMFLVMEYCAGGDLSAYIRKSKRVSEATACALLQQLAAGLRAMWSHHLVHRDLKPQNLLLSDTSNNAVLKIADFGFARALQPHNLAETLCGSPLYMAPEILQFHKYDSKADLWSVGAILYELVVGKPPFTGANHVQLLRAIERSEARIPPAIEATLSPTCRDLITALLKRKPVERISFEELFTHPFLDPTPSRHTTHHPNTTTTNTSNNNTSSGTAVGGRTAATIGITTTGLTTTTRQTAFQVGPMMNALPHHATQPHVQKVQGVMQQQQPQEYHHLHHGEGNQQQGVFGNAQGSHTTTTAGALAGALGNMVPVQAPLIQAPHTPPIHNTTTTSAHAPTLGIAVPVASGGGAAPDGGPATAGPPIEASLDEDEYVMVDSCPFGSRAGVHGGGAVHHADAGRLAPPLMGGGGGGGGGVRGEMHGAAVPVDVAVTGIHGGAAIHGGDIPPQQASAPGQTSLTMDHGHTDTRGPFIHPPDPFAEEEGLMGGGGLIGGDPLGTGEPCVFPMQPTEQEVMWEVARTLDYLACCQHENGRLDEALPLQLLAIDILVALMDAQPQQMEGQPLPSQQPPAALQQPPPQQQQQEQQQAQQVPTTMHAGDDNPTGAHNTTTTTTCVDADACVDGIGAATTVLHTTHTTTTHTTQQEAVQQPQETTTQPQQQQQKHPQQPEEAPIPQQGGSIIHQALGKLAASAHLTAGQLERQGWTGTLPDVVDVVYMCALHMGRGGAVEELLGNHDGALHAYAKAGTLFYFLCTELSLFTGAPQLDTQQRTMLHKLVLHTSQRYTACRQTAGGMVGAPVVC